MSFGERVYQELRRQTQHWRCKDLYAMGPDMASAVANKPVNIINCEPKAIYLGRADYHDLAKSHEGWHYLEGAGTDRLTFKWGGFKVPMYVLQNERHFAITVE